MKKVFVIPFVLLFALMAHAQDSLNIATPDSLKEKHEGHYNYRLYNYTNLSINNIFSEKIRNGASNRFDVDFDYFANSPNVPALLGYDMLFNYNISSKLIDRTDKAIKSRLKFDDYMNTGITYRHEFKKWGGTLIVGYHYRQMIDLSGPKQAFETIFYGNARFEGDTANLGNIRFNFYNYNQYTIGIEKTIDYGKYQVEYGVAGDFLQVINNQQIQTQENTWIYTAPDGEYLGINYDLTYNAALEGAPNFLGKAGFGGTANVHVGVMNKDKWKVTFDINDLGMMGFRKTPVNYSGAKYVEFRGIVIPDLTQFTAETFDTLNLDSAVKANLPS
ncbi:MAG TPA: DUF5723 family protein, partial [Chitinophagales bacterium]|nr:DUF5723 family protein [Chitinophagales bacterium]